MLRLSVFQLVTFVNFRCFCIYECESVSSEIEINQEIKSLRCCFRNNSCDLANTIKFVMNVIIRIDMTQ